MMGHILGGNWIESHDWRAIIRMTNGSEFLVGDVVLMTRAAFQKRERDYRNMELTLKDRSREVGDCLERIAQLAKRLREANSKVK